MELRVMLHRPRHLVLAFAGFAVVAFVLVSLLAVIAGLQSAARNTGSPSMAIVMSSNTDSEIGSSLNTQAVGLVAGLPGVAQIDGKRAVAPELLATVKLPRRANGIEGSVLVRGVSPNVFLLTPNLHIGKGRNFHSGTNELIVGAAAAQAFRWLTPTSIQHFANAHWTVTGTFVANGGYRGSEIWADIHTMQSALNAGSHISIVLAQLTSPAVFPKFQSALKQDKRLNAHAVRQSNYFDRQSRFLSHFVRIAVWGIATLLGAGAIVGILNIMSAALLARTREIGLYRALGFRSGAVISALLTEVVLVGLVAGIIGGICAALIFSGYQAVTSTGTIQLAFALTATPATIGVGIAYAIGLGILSGILPAWQTGRRPIPDSLRAA
jgi:ABC-type lipoprotein release transport system permease subunit